MDGGQGLPLTNTNIATNIVANIATNIATNIVAHQYCHKYCYYTLLSVLFYFMPQESQSQAGAATRSVGGSQVLQPTSIRSQAGNLSMLVVEGGRGCIEGEGRRGGEFICV